MTQLIQSLKDAGEDHEFYPTTPQIASLVGKNIREHFENVHYRENKCVLLDIGAGDGRTLQRILTASTVENFGRNDTPITQLCAIEKSAILRNSMDKDIAILGVDFRNQSLVSKRVDVIFCNPPYSEYEEWAHKIIEEGNCKYAYLVIPRRWRDSQKLQDALKLRSKTASVVSLGEYDFESAERQARAKVEVIRIDFNEGNNKDACFEKFFARTFGDLIGKFENAKEEKQKEEARFNELMLGADLPTRLVAAYSEIMIGLQKNYAALSSLDADLMITFGLIPARIITMLKEKTDSVRVEYWKRLFDGMGKITTRLCASKRNDMLKTLGANTAVDFTMENIEAIVEWVLRVANDYIDTQLTQTFDRLIDQANCQLYKSNKRVYTKDCWRYHSEKKPTHYTLDYRIVLTSFGGISKGGWADKGLSERSAELIGDLLTVANNLGFSCDPSDARLMRYGGTRDSWESNKSQLFLTDSGETLLEVKAFYNGNLHIRLNQRFAKALNVENGRLRGWVYSSKEAEEEMGIKDAGECWQAQFQFKPGQLLLT